MSLNHNHIEALDALCGCAATVTVLSYEEVIAGYFNLRGWPNPATLAAEPLLARQDARSVGVDTAEYPEWVWYTPSDNSSMRYVREDLARPSEEEPVAWMYTGGGYPADASVKRWPAELLQRRNRTITPLYAHPATDPDSVREERAAIVAWLRMEDWRLDTAGVFADRIERGEYRAALSTEEPKL